MAEARTRWALIPGEQQARFVAVSSRWSVQRLLKPVGPIDLSFGAFHEPKAETVMVQAHKFVDIGIDWEDELYCADDEKERLSEQVMLAASIVRAFVALQGCCHGC